MCALQSKVLRFSQQVFIAKLIPLVSTLDSLLLLIKAMPDQAKFLLSEPALKDLVISGAALLFVIEAATAALPAELFTDIAWVKGLIISAFQLARVIEAASDQAATDLLADIDWVKGRDC